MLLNILYDANRPTSLQIEVCRCETIPIDKIFLPVLELLVVAERGYPSSLAGFLAHIMAFALETLTYTLLDGPGELGPLSPSFQSSIML